MTDDRNDCPNPACGRTKPRNKAFCLPCWRDLPHEVQRQVWASYRDRSLGEHIDYLLRLGERLAAGVGPWPGPEPASCRVCGCTDERACAGGCSWVEADLCSACAA